MLNIKFKSTPRTALKQMSFNLIFCDSTKFCQYDCFFETSWETTLES